MLQTFQKLEELRALFRTRPALRQVFLADLVAQLGDGGLLVAFPMLIQERTHDISLTGLAFGAEILAFALTGSFAGYWADRLEQKRVMQASNATRVLILGVILLALASNWPTPVFLGLSFALGAAGAFFHPARAAYMRRLVTGDELQQVIALEGTASFGVRLVSPPLMGVVLASNPATVGIGLDIAAYLVALALVAPGCVSGTPLVLDGAESDDWREGWRFICRHAELRGLLLMDVVLALVGTAAFSTTVALLAESLHLPARDNGWLLATTGLMGACGTLCSKRLQPSYATYAGLTGAIALTYLLVPFAGSLPVLLGMWSLRGFAIGAFCVLLNQRIAAATPAGVMGRVQAAWGQGACLSAALGAGLTPLLLRELGATASFALFGAVLTVLAACLALVSAKATTPELVEAS